MRITNQAIMHNLIKLMNQPDVPAKTKQLIGSIIEGQVIALEGETLSVEVDGEVIKLQNQSSHAFQKGDFISAQIVDVKDGALWIRVADDLPQETEDIPMQLLNKMKLPTTPINQEIVKALIQNEVPVTLTTVKSMQNAIKEVGVFSAEFSTAPEPTREMALANLDKPLKEMILFMMKDEQTPERSNESLSTFKTNDSGHVERLLTTPLANEVIKAEAKGVFEALKQVLNVESSLPDTKVVQELLNQFEVNRSSVLVRENLELTLKNLTLIEAAIQNKNPVSEAFVKLLDQISKLPLKDHVVSQALEILVNEATNDEKVESLLQWAKQSGLSESIVEEMQTQFSIVKELKQVPQGVPDSIAFYQFPIQLEKEFTTVDLYVKKRHKKVDPDDLYLLVALNTHNCGEVRCAVHKMKSHYDLAFSLEEKDTRDLFKMNQLNLEMVLNEMGISDVSIRFGVKELDFVQSFEPEHDGFTIDMKV
ncbi:hypothetical protein [Fusibacter tunisiensis]|uniref:Flagellar hook-length control protein FliK n=1 Tax=Fusibacter tunisiensis TaxID=1008308 RepID=A0ABS2MMF8_9FIRM|nr:hypothetical protein [Fusibacter tunisiensis]MBM7560570.1 hypothetical protein [Fusibacter tunisiensis]